MHVLDQAAAALRAGDVAAAEKVLRRGLAETHEPRLKLELMVNLAIALRLNSKGAEALTLFEQAQALDPRLAGLDLHRAEILQDLKRYDESLAVYRALLAREPLNAPVHYDYNDLLYRLGRSDEYLKSYDAAPQNTDLQLAKADFLMHEKRGDEAHDIYQSILKRAPDERRAAQGMAASLMEMGRPGEAAAAFEALTKRHARDAGLHAMAASAFIRHGDPKHAVTLCEQGLATDPRNNVCLAMLGTAFRVMGDERDEALSGYDTLIRVFDLEPPEGFSGMVAFNAELSAYLDALHPATREHVGQTLRGGSQTSYHMFGAGHDLVNRLQRRIDEALTRYIAEMKADASHPFLNQKRRGFAYAGSWSSRLHDCGFHLNHIHGGWISSCYYAGVPDAVADTREKQGWIKFGEPDFDAGLSFRRAVQPAPGRLVLFPLLYVARHDSFPLANFPPYHRF